MPVLVMVIIMPVLVIVFIMPMVVMVFIVGVFVIVIVRMVVVVIVHIVFMLMVVVVFIMRARGANIDASRGDDDIDIHAGIFYRFQQCFFIANAVDEYQISIGDSSEVAGRRDEVVRVAARRDERADFEVVAGDIARHIRQYAVGCNHDRLRRLSADIDAEQQRQQDKSDYSYFHAFSSLLIRGINKYAM